MNRSLENHLVCKFKPDKKEIKSGLYSKYLFTLLTLFYI